MARTPVPTDRNLVIRMQIVAGRFRHRKLETNPGDTTRPILTRVKIALFDRIQPLLKGALVADVYSGTGTIGLEALSRGAHRITFFEQDAKAFQLLRKNIASLKVEDETITWRTDVTKCSFKPKIKSNDRYVPFDVVFFDPPYAHLNQLAPGTMLFRSLQRLARSEVSAPDANLFVRCDSGAEFAMPNCWQLVEKLVYSSMDVHWFEKVPTAEDAAHHDQLESDEPAALDVVDADSLNVATFEQLKPTIEIDAVGSDYGSTAEVETNSRDDEITDDNPADD